MSLGAESVFVANSSLIERNSAAVKHYFPRDGGIFALPWKCHSLLGIHYPIAQFGGAVMVGAGSNVHLRESVLRLNRAIANSSTPTVRTLHSFLLLSVTFLTRLEVQLWCATALW